MRKEASSGLVGMVDSSGGATAIFKNQYKCTHALQTLVFLLFRYTVPGCYPENGKEVEVDIRSTHKAPRVNTRLAYEARGF